jgi:small-conductance mechanosensitive channel
MDWLSNRLQEVLDLIGPNPYLKALAVILFALAAAKLAGWILTGLIGRWARRTRTDLDDRVIRHLHGPIFASVLLFGLVAATQLLALPETVAWFTMAVLKTIGVWVWMVFAMRIVEFGLEGLSRRRHQFLFIQPSTLPLFQSAAKIALVGAAFYFVMLSWNIDVTAWLASAGIIGIALSFAAKDSLANLFAGLFILGDSPYKVGDYIVLDTGERGKVTRIGMRSTRLLTRDDVEITIPNSVMGNAKIINESGGPYPGERLRVPVGVAYGSDVDHVRRVLLDVALGHKEICRQPAPQVRFREFGDSSLSFELLAWIAEPELRGRMLDELNTLVYKAFAREKIRIPLPQREVHIRSKDEQGEET